MGWLVGFGSWFHLLGSARRTRRKTQDAAYNERHKAQRTPHKARYTAQHSTAERLQHKTNTQPNPTHNTAQHNTTHNTTQHSTTQHNAQPNTTQKLFVFCFLFVGTGGSGGGCREKTSWTQPWVWWTAASPPRRPATSTPATPSQNRSTLR